MKNAGSVIGLILVVAAVAILGYMALNPPPGSRSKETETAANITANLLKKDAVKEQVSDIEQEMTEEAPEPKTEETTAKAMSALKDMQDIKTPDIKMATQENSQEQTTNTTSDENAPEINAPSMMVDRVLGDEDAPVTVIEYASLSCPHCAHFAKDILPEFKKRFVETGRVKLIYRDYPLDQYALKAAKLARCAPEDKYFSFIDVLFRNQDRWIKSEDPLKVLKQFGTLAGMDQQYMEYCLLNEELESYLLRNVQEAQGKYAIRSTPTFVINYGAEVLSGAQPVEKFEEVLKRLGE